MTSGGKRPGSGRKAGPHGVKVVLTARVYQMTLEWLRVEAERRGYSVGELLDALIETRIKRAARQYRELS